MGFIDRAGVRIVRTLKYPINTSATIIVALYTFMWGLWLLTPAWNTFDQAPLYSAMAEASPEWIWGAIAMISGTFMMYGVLKPSFRSLSGSAFTGAVHWGIICVFYLMGDWQNTGGLTAGMVATYCTFVYLNLRVNREIVRYDL